MRQTKWILAFHLHVLKSHSKQNKFRPDMSNISDHSSEVNPDETEDMYSTL